MEPELKFKICTCCGESWNSQTDFFTDPSVSFIGHQHFYAEGCQGLLLFNHTCGTTFSVEVDRVAGMHERPYSLEIALKGHLPDTTAMPTIGCWGAK